MKHFFIILIFALTSCQKVSDDALHGNTKVISKYFWADGWAFVPDEVQLYCHPTTHAIAVLYPFDTENEIVYALNGEAKIYAQKWKMPWQDVRTISNGKDLKPFETMALELCNEF